MHSEERPQSGTSKTLPLRPPGGKPLESVADTNVAAAPTRGRLNGTPPDGRNNLTIDIDKNSVCHQYKIANVLRILAQLNVPGTVITGAPPPAGIDIPPGSQQGACIVGRHSSNAGVQTGAHGCMVFAGEQPQGVVFWKHEGAFMPPAPPKQLVHPGAAIRPDRRTAPHINRFTFVIVVITTSPERRCSLVSLQIA